MTETTTVIRRLSPVSFQAAPSESEERDGWTVVLRYENEGDGPWLADLSHKTRWDVQNGRLDDLQPGGVAVPQAWNRCVLSSGLLINRMNRTQAAVWHLKNESSDMPSESAYTDVTEAAVFLALFGPHTFRIAEKLSALDFLVADAETPFLLQGPFSHVPCQIVVLQREKGGAGGGILLTCSRGYARSMVHAISDAGQEFGLRPAGERAFSDWLGSTSL